MIKKNSLWYRIVVNYQLYLILLIPTLYIVIFKYVPMLGAQIAFRNFSVTKGFWRSDWVGLYHFKRFFASYQFSRVILNTIGVSVYFMAVAYPIPIIFALSLNSTNILGFKKTVQTATYIPHFISTVVMVGMIMQFLSPRIGIINELRQIAGLKALNFVAIPGYFKSIYVWSAVWQNTGWWSIVYIAALAGIDPNLHEAAIIDGATKFQRVLHIDIPGITPTAIIILIIVLGQMMNVGFEKVFLLQNDLNLRSSEVIQTYVYKVGLASSSANYSYATAIGLFNSVINLFLILTANRIAKKLGDTSLW